MGEWLSYVLLGVSLSAPIGPINSAQLDKGLKHGFISAWMVGLGAMAADGGYMVLIYFGLSTLFHLPGVRVLLWISGSVVLMYLGVESLVNSRRSHFTSATYTESATRSLATGFLMAASNPLNFMFWFGIYGSLLAQATNRQGNTAFFRHSSGIFMGIFMWDIAMAVVASMFQKYASKRVLQVTSVVAGLSLIGFAGYFAFQTYHALTFTS